MGKKSLTIVAIPVILLFILLVFVLWDFSWNLSFDDSHSVAVIEVSSEVSTTKTPVELPELGNDQPESDRRYGSGNHLVILILSLLTLLSVSTSFYLYRWRRILIGNQAVLVPEEWAKCLNNMASGTAKLEYSIQSEFGRMYQSSEMQNKGISAMTETFMTLQKSLNEKDEEIRRLKQGYDELLFKRFLLRFIRADQVIEEFINEENGDQKSLKMIKRLVEDALDECGVEFFEPELNEDYRSSPGVADNPTVEYSEDSGNYFKIANIVSTGYRLRKAEGAFDIIVPAKVSIFGENPKGR
jgi:hypothetical protein